MVNHVGSEYVKEQRRVYSLYTLQSRAIPHAADGLKAAARRVLWMARDGKTHKSATLAGATMPIHPHDSPDDTVSTLAGPYINNVTLFKGDGAFGTLLNPKAFGATRYTSVTTSQFTKDVMFRDIEIIPMKENYDSSCMEPKHFLPLMPITLLNPQEGIAVGFASNILPRNPNDIVKHQIAYLEGNVNFKEPNPALLPIKQTSTGRVVDRLGTQKWEFKGSFEKKDAVTLIVTNLPYKLTHEKFIERLIKLEEDGKIQDFEDGSKNMYNIIIKFKKGELRKMSEDDIYKLLGLVNSHGENFTTIDFDGERVWEPTYIDMIKKFTDWRLTWYVNRYERLSNLLQIDIQRYKDILLAIKHNIGSSARTIKSREELKQKLSSIGIVNLDYIADLPVYRFTEDEKYKIETKLKEAQLLMKEYNLLLKHESKRKDVYISELKDIQQKLKKGVYG